MTQNLNSQRRMAAEIMKCGESRVRIDPEHVQEVAKAITRKDIRRFIREGYISKALPGKKAKKPAKGRKKQGSRKGKKMSRQPQGTKTKWLHIVRPQRQELRKIKPELVKKPGRSYYRELYRMIKGNMFRSRAHLILHVNERKLIKKAKV